MMAVKKKTETIKADVCGQASCCGGHVIYGLGFIGAVIYYIAAATGFWSGVLGFLKAIIWPVFMVYGALKFLGM